MASFQRFRLIFDRELADGAVNQIDPATVSTETAELVELVTTPDPVFGAFLSGPQNFFRYSDDDLRSAVVRSLLDDDLIAVIGDDVSAVVTALLAAANQRSLNGTALCLPFVDTPVGPGQARIHEPLVALGAATTSLFGTLPPWSVAIDATLTPVGGRSGRGAFHVGRIVEPAPDGTVPLAASADELRRILATSSPNVEIFNPATPSSPIQIQQAALAAIDPAGRLFLAPSDLGAGPGLIDPTSLIGNTAALYNLHPTMFVRRAPNIRGVGAVDVYRQGWGSAADGPYPVTDYRGALSIYVITARPNASVWRFWIDGAPVDVTLAHPAGLDLRRPRDVWNALIAPILASGSPYNAPAVVSQGTVDFSRPGVVVDAGTLSLVLGTTRYVQAARCLGFVGDGGVRGLMEYTPQVPGDGPRPPSLMATIAARTDDAAARIAAFRRNADAPQPQPPSE